MPGPRQDLVRRASVEALYSTRRPWRSLTAATKHELVAPVQASFVWFVWFVDNLRTPVVAASPQVSPRTTRTALPSETACFSRRRLPDAPRSLQRARKSK